MTCTNYHGVEIRPDAFLSAGVDLSRDAFEALIDAAGRDIAFVNLRGVQQCCANRLTSACSRRARRAEFVGIERLCGGAAYAQS